MGAMLEPAPEAPKPQALAELHERELARAALIRDRTAARNRAGQASLPLLKHQHARALKAIERALAEVEAIERALAEVDAAIAALVEGDATLARKAAILVSIPCVSAVTAAAVLAEMPELGTLEPGAAASLAGLAPFTRQSGRWPSTCRR